MVLLYKLSYYKQYSKYSYVIGFPVQYTKCSRPKWGRCTWGHPPCSLSVTRSSRVLDSGESRKNGARGKSIKQKPVYQSKYFIELLCHAHVIYRQDIYSFGCIWITGSCSCFYISILIFVVLWNTCLTGPTHTESATDCSVELQDPAYPKRLEYEIIFSLFFFIYCYYYFLVIKNVISSCVDIFN